MRRGPKAAKSKEAKPPAARKSPKNDGARVRDQEKRLAEALEQLQTRDQELVEAQEQQAATAEILRVIRQSPNDAQPVFDAIVASAVRLCGGLWGTLYRRYGDMVDSVASCNVPPAVRDLLRNGFPRPLRTGTSPHFHRALIEGTVTTIPNVETDPDLSPRVLAFCRHYELRSVVMIPLRGQHEILGVLVVGHAQVEAFSDRHMSLLQTFADQAVIAIENVRLFDEVRARTREVTQTLEYQTATADVLNVISRSPTDPQPVFDMIAESAARLCEAQFCFVYRFEEDLLHFVAHQGLTAEVLEMTRRVFPAPPSRRTAAARALLTRSVVQIPEVTADLDYATDATAWAGGYRSVAAVPMLREGLPIGAIAVTRPQAGQLPVRQVELLKTFADQAVIAIENVRLFTELQASNRELTRALDTQTATSDILRVISRSQTDVQPVFDAIVQSAARLLRGRIGLLTQAAEGRLVLVALTSTDATGDASLRALFPQSIHAETPHTRAFRDRAPVNIADCQTDPRVGTAGQAYARGSGVRSVVVVPVLRRDEAIGTLVVTRSDPGGFTAEEIALLQTFADQAVIAIENARLLTELQARTAELSR